MPETRTRTSAPAAAQPATAFDPVCFLKQIEVLHGQLPTALYASFIAALLAASVCLKLAPGNAAIDWLILYTLMTGVRVYFGLIRNQHQHTIVTASEWCGYFILGCFMSGCMWAWFGMALVPALEVPYLEAVFLHAVVILFIAALTAGAVITYRASQLAMLAFTLPAVVPYAVFLIAQESVHLAVLGTLFLMYFLFMILIGSRYASRPASTTRTVLRR
ncbi:MAG: hypothetical protein MI673_04465 [Thiotrichales bacterium]|nr:hypothetical protein [Thiotrichales bacterium]